MHEDIRIWKADFRMLPSMKEDLGVYFISNLVGHRSSVSVARFSPNGMKFFRTLACYALLPTVSSFIVTSGHLMTIFIPGLTFFFRLCEPEVYNSVCKTSRKKDSCFKSMSCRWAKKYGEA